MKPCPSASPLAALPWARPRAKERCIRPVGHSEPHWNEIWEWESGKLGKVRTYRLPGVPRDPPPSASEIRRIVQEKLAGLMERQKKREARRARSNQCQNRRRGNRNKGVRIVRSSIVFRATFEQPTGALNPAGIKMAGPVEVEIYHQTIGPPAEWRVRRPGTRNDFRLITPQSTPDTLKKQMDLFFRTQLAPWEAFDNKQSPPRVLEASDWRTDKDGKVFLTESYLEKLKQEKTKNTVTAK